MPIDPELYPLFAQTIICQNPLPITSYTPVNSDGLLPPAIVGAPVLDAYGRHVGTSANPLSPNSAARYSAAKTYKCRLEYATRVMMDAEGRERVSSGRAYLMGVFPEITTESLLTVDEVQPALRHPVLINVTTDNDELGPHNTTLHFE
jgi:hypothetical protein